MNKQNIIQYPYARPKALDELFDLIRKEASWNPSVINVKTLKTLGIAPSKEIEAISCLIFIGLIDNEGKLTDVFSRTRENFQKTLLEQVQKSYKEIFDQIPISRINQETLVNFFMGYGFSEDTAEYQGVLFVYFCKKGGIDIPNADASFKRARFKKKKL